MIETATQVLNSAAVMSQLLTVDKKVQNKTVRKATTAAGKVVLKESQRTARSFKQTGYTARSLRSVTSSRKGTTTVRVGQSKQKRFKARKSPRLKGRNLSELQRAGKPVPIHWIELGTKAHVVRAQPGKRLVFIVGRRSKYKSGLAFATQVRIPRTAPRSILRTSAVRSKAAAAAAFESVVEAELRSTNA